MVNWRDPNVLGAAYVVTFVINVIALSVWFYTAEINGVSDFKVRLFHDFLEHDSGKYTTTQAFAVIGAIFLAAATLLAFAVPRSEKFTSMHLGITTAVASLCDFIAFGVFVSYLNLGFLNVTLHAGPGLVLLFFVAFFCLLLTVGAFMANKASAGKSSYPPSQPRPNTEMQMASNQPSPTATYAPSQTAGGFAPPPPPPPQQGNPFQQAVAQV